MLPVVKTFRYRVKDKHATELNRMARAANFVWNYCNEIQRTAVQRGQHWPTAFDLCYLTAGTSRDLGISAVTISGICHRYVDSRRGAHRRLLRWRGKRSLGWVPFRSKAVRRDGPTGFRYFGRTYDVWLSRDTPGPILSGNFSVDARGRWYLNAQCEVAEAEPRTARREVGIDLGLKDLATLSNGERAQAPQFFRASADRLGMAQRAGKKHLARTIHARISHQRADFLHKISARLVRDFDFIAVGNVSPRRLARTRLAKSVYDAGWSTLRRMLSYKAIEQGATYREVCEYGSTTTCSDCGFVGGPKGREGLVVREWTCAGCGVVHDRDVNAAQNILRWSHPTPTGALGASRGDGNRPSLSAPPAVVAHPTLLV